MFSARLRPRIASSLPGDFSRAALNAAFAASALPLSERLLAAQKARLHVTGECFRSLLEFGEPTVENFPSRR
jgi:hypothetical protein